MGYEPSIDDCSGCRADVVAGGRAAGSFKTLHSSTYRGKVLDAETKEPVAKARVELSNYGEMRDKAKTDEHGEFEVGPLYCWSWIGKGWPYYEGRFCRHKNRRQGKDGRRCRSWFQGEDMRRGRSSWSRITREN